MCLSPLTINRDGFLSRVRCGQCRACRVRRKQAWVGRLRLERLEHRDARFLTLTYRNDNRPEVLPLEDLRNFLKRYRYYYGPCRYFAVGEYGSKNGNGHWHVMIFGHAPIAEVKPWDKKGKPWPDCKAWTLGFVGDGNCNVESIGYVSGYTLKGSDDVNHRPICRQSRKPGIGFARIGQMGVIAAREPLLAWPSSYRVNGRRYPLCDGGLARFQVSYLEAGGVPPVTESPEARDARARADLSDWGTRFREDEIARAASYREVVDVFASKKAR